MPSHTRASRTARPYQEHPCSTTSSPSWLSLRESTVMDFALVFTMTPDGVFEPHSFPKVAIASYSPSDRQEVLMSEVDGCTRKSMAHLRLSRHPCLAYAIWPQGSAIPMGNGCYLRVWSFFCPMMSCSEVLGGWYCVIFSLPLLIVKLHWKAKLTLYVGIRDTLHTKPKGLT